MAAFVKVIIAIWAFAVMAAAVPLNLRRDVSMVTETAYTTVDVSVTLMVDENGVPFETVGPSNEVTPITTTAVTTVTTPVTSVATPSSAPAQSEQTTASAVVSSSFPPTTMVTVAPITTTQPVVAAAPVPSSSSTVAAAAPAPTDSGSSGSADSSQISASAVNSCLGESDACLGDITHYDGGLSACGQVVDTNTQMGIALPFEFMGTASNDNPYCGRTLTIHNPTTGDEIQAYVADKCMGCTGRAIDLTNAAFNAIAPTCDGRCSGFEWWFN